VTVHGSNGATIGVQTDGGAMFIAGMSNIIDPPINDVWTVPGESQLLPQWQQEDKTLFNSVNAVEHYHRLQIQDFLRAIIDRRQPLVSADDGRRTVELITAIYRASRDRTVIRFPLSPEPFLRDSAAPK
jgi:predicted dehydrogenase